MTHLVAPPRISIVTLFCALLSLTAKYLPPKEVRIRDDDVLSIRGDQLGRGEMIWRTLAP